jgi:hypothetical protein
MRRLLVGLVLLAACESDAKRLERLQRDLSYARIDEGYWQRADAKEVDDSLMIITDTAAIRDSLDAARIRRALAERALNRFMAGQ